MKNENDGGCIWKEEKKETKKNLKWFEKVWKYEKAKRKKKKRTRIKMEALKNWPTGRENLDEAI